MTDPASPSAASPINLGSKVRDTHTGFIGMATQRTETLHGCPRVCIEGYLDKDGRIPKPEWFDEPRLEIVNDEKPKAGFKP
jgi:hypothetical protein